MHLSIVSGTYNRLNLLQAMVASARVQLPIGMEYEFVLVDGGSTDGTIEWAKAQPDVVLIEQGELLGAIKAFDAGAFAARGKYIILANDDIQFRPGGILRALVHLEDHPTCGAVAFRDNRLNKDLYRVSPVPANAATGASISVPYAQVGMFRKWLGDHVGWWGLHGTFPARTYAGDNAVSAAIWETGYTIDDVPGCEVEDFIYHDDLRNLNVANPGGGEHPDSAAYYALWPRGPQLPPAPTVKPPTGTKREIGLRILYLPIIEAGGTPGSDPHRRRSNQLAQKRGLRDALGKYGAVYEFDYLTYQFHIPELQRDLLAAIDLFKPDVLFTQVHATDVLTVDVLRNIRIAAPRMVVVNWNGDYWPEALSSNEMLRWLRQIDLQLVVNVDILKLYKENDIAAAYWQASYEHPPGDLPSVPAHEVVWLAQNYHPERRIMGDALKPLKAEGIEVAIYGSGWEAGEAYGDNTYDFRMAWALYRNAKVALGNNHFPHQYGFVSDRIWMALAGGGAILLHQHVRGLQTLTGLVPGVHYVEWHTYPELLSLIRYYVDPAHEDERRQIAQAGYEFVVEHHSFEARLRELFSGGNGKAALISLAKQKPRKTVAIEYRGRRKEPFGVRGAHTQQQYECTPGRLFVMDTLDWERLKSIEPDIWQEVGTAQDDFVGEAIG